MSKTVGYVVVGLAAFAAGGLSYHYFFCWAGCCGVPAGQPASQPAGIQAGSVIEEFAIDGMSCQGCAESVAAALKKMPGVHAVKVSLPEKKAIVAADQSQVSADKIAAAVAAAGYKARPMPAAETSGAAKPGEEQAKP
jgi:copper chaperone CopZ